MKKKMKKNTTKKNSSISLAKAALPVLFLILLLTATACQNPFNLTTVLGLEMGVLTLSPANTTIASSGTQILTVSGGTGPYTWIVYSGPGTISVGGTATETYDPGGLTGLATIKVTDSEGYFGTAAVTIKNIDPLILLTGTQKLYPGGSTQLYASGGDGSYTYSVDTDSSGVTLNAGTGAYTAGATPGIDILMVTDGLSATKTVSIEVIDPAASIPDIDYRVNTMNASLPGQIGAAITADFTHQNIGTVGGGNNVQWNAYVSTTPNMNGIISLADSGTVSALNAGTISAAPQAIGGSWPSNPGTYYIVVHLSAVADVNTANNAGASGAVAMTVDYHLTITPGGASVMTGDVMSVDYELSNSGNVSGTATVNWAAYLSSDTNYGAGDSRIDSGSFGALAGSDSDPQTITVNSIWPAVGGTYYIILEWLSADDTASPEYGASGVYTVDVPDVDYGPGSSLTIPPGGSIVVGTIGNEIFRIENFGTDNGTQMIDWNAWLSIDAIPGNAGDIHVDSNTTGPLNTGVESGDLTVNIDWDIAPEDYNLIITWNAADDVNPANDSMTSTTLYLVRYPDVDYETSVTPAGGGSLLTGDAISETFEIINSGTEDGAQNVDWSAWVSLDMTLNAGDIQVDSGSIGSLNSGISSGVLPIIGNWPDIPGNYYLIVTWTAIDDNDPLNDSMVSDSVSAVSFPVNDYSITSVPAPGGTTTAGDTVSGTFSVQNLGPDDDTSEGFSWTAYASSDTGFNTGDAQIDSGAEPFQAAMDTPLVVNYNGMWPDIGGDYHIVVIIDSTHDPDPLNNENYDTLGPTEVVNMTDYEISLVNYHPLGEPGTPLAAAPLPPAHPAYIPYEFTLNEIGGKNCNRKVDYTVYASIDTILDGGDTVLKSTFILANDIVLGGGTITEPFDDGNPWPGFPTEYYIIVTINAADDVNAANDIYVAGPVQVAVQVPDSEPNDGFGPYTAPSNLPAPTDFTDLNPFLSIAGTGELRPNEIVRIDGIMEAYNVWDTVGFVAGPGMTTIQLEATWATGFDDVDIYLWDQNGHEIPEWLTADTADDIENLTVINITPGETIYIGVWFYMDNNRGSATGTETYTLTLTGLP